MYLPYSMMVKQINDLIASGIQEIYKYWSNLLTNENDLVLFFSSIDRMVT